MANQKLAMVIDAPTCLDCKGCLAACKVANNVPDGKWRNWIKGADPERRASSPVVFQPGNCMQCDKPTCVEACPTGATYKNQADGTVVINRTLCIGCGQCLAACPYGARFKNTDLGVADKCDFCAERRKFGLEPACVSTCPTKSRKFGDLNDANSEVAKLLKANRAVRVANEQTRTDPNIYYLGEPGPTNWTVQARMPEAFDFWRRLADPVVKAVVGLSGLGVLAMLGKQLAMPKDAPPADGGAHEEAGHE
ncbi:4Fe-4S ferredoxin [Desulfocarbo indianensis]|nr:4Fe-4S ferredoxin [Desulfocarbo indianensis]